MPDYTIDEIDTGSIKLNGITATMVHAEDAATPYPGTERCGCHNLTADGISDIVFQVDSPPVIQTLDKPAKKSFIPLTVTGMSTDGLTLIKGGDCVRISYYSIIFYFFQGFPNGRCIVDLKIGRTSTRGTPETENVVLRAWSTCSPGSANTPDFVHRGITTFSPERKK